MLSLYEALFGISEFLLPRIHGNEVLNFLLDRGIECRISVCEDSIFIRCAYRNAKALRDFFAESSLEVSEEKDRGALPALRKSRMRIGIPVGVALFLLFTVISGCVVWRIDISGNAALDDEWVMQALENSGFTVGKSTRFSAGELAARCVADNEELAWMSIRMEGTTAKVRVIEATTHTLPTAEDGRNLVATRDALIVAVDALRGRVNVAPGVVVRVGDVLVSGVIEGAHGTLFLEAEGSVLGQVTETFREEVPLSSWEKNYLSPQNGEICIKILGFSINIFKSTGNLPTVYDTIYLQDTVRLGGRSLPISCVRTQYVPYTVTERLLKKEVAADYAEYLLSERVRAAVGSGELLEMNTEVIFEGDKCVAVCTVTYVCEIAKSVPFKINE